MIPDPRERLIRTGQELLDAIYAVESNELGEILARPQAEREDAIAEFVTRGRDAAKALIEAVTAVAQRDLLVKEYVLLRSTIEAMEERSREHR